jgi:hypothetical protein
MSGLAVFGLKHASLLSFDNDRDKPRTRHDLQHLYGVKDKAPSDTHLREVLDEIAPEVCRPATVKVMVIPRMIVNAMQQSVFFLH